jgi:hypothetical protein
MAAMRAAIFWRAGLVQLVAVALLSEVLAIVFSHGFFVDWGWLAGPAAWLFCAWVTARVVGLEVGPTLARAVLAGVVSAIAVVFGLHWIGIPVAVLLFAALCARVPGAGARWI